MCGAQFVLQFGQQGADIHRGMHFHSLLAFDPRQPEQLLEQVFHAHRLLQHLLQRLDIARVQPAGIAEKGTQVAADDREGGAQFMGHVRHEILAHLFHAHTGGDIAYEQQAVAVAKAGNLHPQPGARIACRTVFQRLTKITKVEISQKFRRPHQVHEALTLVRRAQPEQGLGRFVEPFQQAVIIDDGHAVAHGRKGILQVIHRGLQTIPGLPAFFLQLVDFAEDIAPDAVSLRRRLPGAAQPALDALHLVEPEPDQ